LTLFATLKLTWIFNVKLIGRMVMKRLTMLVLSGFLVSMLAACGHDKGTAKPAAGTAANAPAQAQGAAEKPAAPEHK
jgi:hypothetical protein